MEVSACVVPSDNPLESIKVQLSLEGFVLGVAIVPRQDFLTESLDIEYSEGIPIAYPSDYGGVFLVKDRVQF